MEQAWDASALTLNSISVMGGTGGSVTQEGAQASGTASLPNHRGVRSKKSQKQEEQYNRNTRRCKMSSGG